MTLGKAGVLNRGDPKNCPNCLKWPIWSSKNPFNIKTFTESSGDLKLYVITKNLSSLKNNVAELDLAQTNWKHEALTDECSLYRDKMFYFAFHAQAVATK